MKAKKPRSAVSKRGRLARPLMVEPVEVESAHHELFLLQRVHQTNRDKAVGAGVWKRAEKDAVNDAEDCGGGADAERQRDNDSDGESRIAPEPAQCVPQVLTQCAYPPAGLLLVAVFSRLRDSAEFDQGFMPRCFRRHPLSDLCRDCLLKMELEFLIHLMCAPACEQAAA
jgi:hypothetical protein